MIKATRLVTIAAASGNKISYWKHGEQVFRLNEYEPVQFDIYGVPLGARWETNFFHWPQLLALLIPQGGNDANIMPLGTTRDRQAELDSLNDPPSSDESDVCPHGHGFDTNCSICDTEA